MKKRLFILGDSFVDWEIPKFHWTWYLEKHYEVFKFGKYGADNYSILFQLGNLPEYEDGDRIIMYFTEPGRLPRRFYGIRKKQCISTPFMNPSFYEDMDFANKLHNIKYNESERWVNGERGVEVSFLKKLKNWIKNYEPVFVTWSEHFHTQTSDFVKLIKVSSNYDEGIAEEKDFHPGPKGCYEIYKIFHNLLSINDEIVEFENYRKDLL